MEFSLRDITYSEDKDILIMTDGWKVYFYDLKSLDLFYVIDTPESPFQL